MAPLKVLRCNIDELSRISRLEAIDSGLVPCLRADRIWLCSSRSRPSQSPMGVSVARQTLSLTLQNSGAAMAREVGIDDAIVAGWTGRDATAVEKHITELEALGVGRQAPGRDADLLPRSGGAAHHRDRDRGGGR